MSDETQHEPNGDEETAPATPSGDESESSGVDQSSLADEWEKMAEAGEINLDAEAVEEPDTVEDEAAVESTGPVQSAEGDDDQQAMIDEWEQMAAGTPDAEAAAPALEPVYGGVDFTTLMDIPLEVTVEVGNASMSIDELLHLTPNSVIELDKFISEPVDIRVNGRLIAQGELFTEGDSFAIKITAIMTPQDRMKLVDEQAW